MLSRSPGSPGVKLLRIIERVEGFILQRFDDRGASMGDLQFDTMDEAMQYAYSEYERLADWTPCPDDTSGPTGRLGSR